MRFPAEHADREVDARGGHVRRERMDVYHREWKAGSGVKRATVDLSRYPDLVVMYLGLSLRSPRGIFTILKLVRRIRAAVKERPDGLLLHEPMIFFPFTFGMRQYWRDFDSLEAWARADPHRTWWKEYLHDTEGTGLWHETYFMNGGIEAVYDNVRAPVGLTHFADVVPAEGSMFNARMRAELARRREAFRHSEPE